MWTSQKESTFANSYWNYENVPPVRKPLNVKHCDCFKPWLKRGDIKMTSMCSEMCFKSDLKQKEVLQSDAIEEHFKVQLRTFYSHKINAL